MPGQYTSEPMLDMFIFETTQLIEQLEQSILDSEKSDGYTQNAINEIFRIMHTIKGSSAMMMFENISSLTHSIEDLFYFLREEKPVNINYSVLSDLVLESIDFIKIEIEKIKNGDAADGNASGKINSIKEFLTVLKHNTPSSSPNSRISELNEDTLHKYYISADKMKAESIKNIFKAVINFEEGCQMENIRAYSIVHGLKELADEVLYAPEDIIDNDESAEAIKRDGFKIWLKSVNSYEKLHEFFMKTVFLKDLDFTQLDNDEEIKELVSKQQENPYAYARGISTTSSQVEHKTAAAGSSQPATAHQSIISVNVAKLDKLMDLVGEMVIAEAMVVQNPDLDGLELSNFQKAARQLHKITGEMQDMVMSIRMVPVAMTFQKMNRIVRDMSKKLGKEINLKLIGEETEVDKNIIEHISDPIMHLIRNAIDHGIEPVEDRVRSGKSQAGTVILEAKNAGSDVLITVRDDGKGLNKEKILKRARDNGLLHKPENEMPDKEIYNLIFLPGFSTTDYVSEFSGRGVGMDVVTKNIESVGGSVSVDSTEGAGTVVTLKIPLTLAIIDGMNVKVGNSCYTIPTTSISESFRPGEKDIINDPDGNEMIMVRGQCYPVLRLHKYYGIRTSVTDFDQGILVMVEADEKAVCIFADELLGQQQVVVKALPNYIKHMKQIRGLAGCTLLGNGSISLILDINNLLSPS